MWDGREWPDAGEGWSAAWGGVDSQWHGTILNRIRAFVPAATILEIAPGYGRWTRYLKDLCQRLVAVDLSERCIGACRARFADAGHASFHLNDGTSLAVVPDESVDFAFSFDSLVHADADVIAAYLGELAAKLAPDGAGFFHHSNLGAYRDAAGQLPHGVLNPHWRSTEVSARTFAESCERAGLCCVSQEIVNWGGEALNDCFSVFARRGSRWDRPLRVHTNPRFMDEARHFAELSRLYGRDEG